MTMHVELASGVMFQDLGEEAILLDMDQGYYYGLDAVGTRFWQLLTDGHTMDAAVAELLELFDVDEVTLRSDLDVLLAELQATGLATVA